MNHDTSLVHVCSWIIYLGTLRFPLTTIGCIGVLNYERAPFLYATPRERDWGAGDMYMECIFFINEHP